MDATGNFPQVFVTGRQYRQPRVLYCIGVTADTADDTRRYKLTADRLTDGQTDGRRNIARHNSSRTGNAFS